MFNQDIDTPVRAHQKPPAMMEIMGKTVDCPTDADQLHVFQ